MKLTFIFDDGNNVNAATSLKLWLENSDLVGFDPVLQRKKLNGDDAAAGLVEGILAVVLTAPSVIILARSLHVWLRERTKQKGSKLKMKIKKGRTSIEIDVENAKESEEYIIDLLTKRLTK